MRDLPSTRVLTSLLIASVAAAMPLAVQAQQSTAAPTSSTDSTQLEEVTVTGTHLQISGADAPTPVTVVNSDTIAERAPADIMEVLNQLPSFRPTTQTAGSDRLSLSQSGVQGLIDLRGLGATRTLTLVDGERFTPGNMAGLVDTNMIPIGLIDRIDVVTGGASAAYGSDAVAGVVNFILKDKFEGVTFSLQRGESEYSDEQEWVGSFAAGTSLFDNRAHFVFGADYAKNDGAGTFYTRPYGQLEPGLISNGAGHAMAGLPAQSWANGVEIANATPGGIINGGPLAGTAFDANGNPYPFQYGTVHGSAMTGSQANYGNNPQGYAIVGNPFNRETSYAKFTVDVTDKTEAFVSGNFAETGSSSIGAPPTSVGALTIGVNNPYLPTSVHDAMVADGLNSISVGKIFSTVGGNSQEITNHLWRVAAGMKGEIFNDWKWDFYATTGQTNEFYNFNGIYTANIQAASNVITGANGQPECAPLAAGSQAQAGCVPFDVFGVSSKTTDPAAYGYMFHNIWSVERMKEHAVAANLSGSPVSDWAGPVQVGVGAEYRWDGLSVNSDPIGASGVYYTSGQANFSGHNSVKEVYVEGEVPLLDNGPIGAKKLDLNLAGRATDYAIEGSVRTYKVGFTDSITDSLRLRLMHSQDIRAPNLYELFGVGPPAIQLNINNPANGATGSTDSVQSGNPNLKPETAKTMTAGLVYEIGSSDTRFTASVDYFDIRLTDLIASGVGVQSTVTGCANGIQAYCNLITYDPAGPNPNDPIGITKVALQSVNLNRLYVNGVDMEFSLHQNRLPFGLPGSLDWHLLGSYTNHMSLTTAAGTYNYAGTAATIGSAGTFPNGGGVPTWHGDLTVTYALKPITAQLQFTGFDSILYNPTLVGPDNPAYNPAASNSISQNKFQGEIYTNLTLGYQPIENVQIYGVINNVFDRWPPAYALNAFSTNEADYYDTVGRYYKLGVRLKF